METVITYGKEYKLTEVLPVDVLLFMAYSEGWKLSEKFTRVQFVPAEYYGINYILPLEVSPNWNNPEVETFMSTATNVLRADIKKIADDERRVWRVGYAPEINVLYIGVGRDGQICFAL